MVYACLYILVGAIRGNENLHYEILTGTSLVLTYLPPT